MHANPSTAVRRPIIVLAVLGLLAFAAAMGRGTSPESQCEESSRAKQAPAGVAPASRLPLRGGERAASSPKDKATVEVLRYRITSAPHQVPIGYHDPRDYNSVIADELGELLLDPATGRFVYRWRLAECNRQLMWFYREPIGKPNDEGILWMYAAGFDRKEYWVANFFNEKMTSSWQATEIVRYDQFPGVSSAVPEIQRVPTKTNAPRAYEPPFTYIHSHPWFNVARLHAIAYLVGSDQISGEALLSALKQSPNVQRLTTREDTLMRIRESKNYPLGEDRQVWFYGQKRDCDVRKWDRSTLDYRGWTCALSVDKSGTVLACQLTDANYPGGHPAFPPTEYDMTLDKERTAVASDVFGFARYAGDRTRVKLDKSAITRKAR